MSTKKAFGRIFEHLPYPSEVIVGGEVPSKNEVFFFFGFSTDPPLKFLIFFFFFFLSSVVGWLRLRHPTVPLFCIPELIPFVSQLFAALVRIFFFLAVKYKGIPSDIGNFIIFCGAKKKNIDTSAPSCRNRTLYGGGAVFQAHSWTHILFVGCASQSNRQRCVQHCSALPWFHVSTYMFPPNEKREGGGNRVVCAVLTSQLLYSTRFYFLFFVFCFLFFLFFFSFSCGNMNVSVLKYTHHFIPPLALFTYQGFPLFFF